MLFLHTRHFQSKLDFLGVGHQFHLQLSALPTFLGNTEALTQHSAIPTNPAPFCELESPLNSVIRSFRRPRSAIFARLSPTSAHLLCAFLRILFGAGRCNGRKSHSCLTYVSASLYPAPVVACSVINSTPYWFPSNKFAYFASVFTPRHLDL